MTAVVATPLVEIETGAVGANGGDAAVGVDRGKGVVGDIDIGPGRRRVERRFPRVGFAREGEREHTSISRKAGNCLSVSLPLSTRSIYPMMSSIRRGSPERSGASSTIWSTSWSVTSG